MSFYQILWDNGHATDAFSAVFSSKKAANAFGAQWKRGMVLNDPDEKAAREEYSWELIPASSEGTVKLIRDRAKFGTSSKSATVHEPGSYRKRNKFGTESLWSAESIASYAPSTILFVIAELFPFN